MSRGAAKGAARRKGELVNGAGTDLPNLVCARRHDPAARRDGDHLRVLPDELADRSAPAIREQHQRIAGHALAKDRELLALVGALPQRSVELRERRDGDVELLRERLEAARNLTDLLLARVDALVSLHQLQVVDDDEPERRFAVGEAPGEPA